MSLIFDSPKLSQLRKMERDLVMAFIEYTKMHDYDSVTEFMIFDFARELRIPAALRRGALERVIDAEVLIRDKGAYDPINEVEPVIRIHPSFYNDAAELYLGFSSPEQETEWEPLQLDRSSSDATEAIAASEALLEAVRGDNGFAATAPETHNSVVWSLRTGIDAVKSHYPTKDQIKDLLKKPIDFLLKRFGGAVLGDLAEKAAHALSQWLGSLF